MIAVGICIVAVLIAYLLFFLDGLRFVVKSDRIIHPKIDTAFTIVQVSDLHDRLFGANQSGLIDAVREAKPRAIVITGDLFNRHIHSACKNAFAFVRESVRIAPVYFAEGNHEIALGETGEKYIETIQKMGVTVLRDEFVDLPGIRIIGQRQYAAPQTLSAMLSPDRLNLVLSHRPELFPIYAGTGPDVVLSGHAHGGQIRLFGKGVFAPGQGFFPRFTSGQYSRQNSILLVSKGLGNTIPVPRIFNTPELNVVEFCPSTSKGE